MSNGIISSRRSCSTAQILRLDKTTYLVVAIATGNGAENPELMLILCLVGQCIVRGVTDAGTIDKERESSCIYILFCLTTTMSSSSTTITTNSRLQTTEALMSGSLPPQSSNSRIIPEKRRLRFAIKPSSLLKSPVIRRTRTVGSNLFAACLIHL